jgi:hypothetical protein
MSVIVTRAQEAEASGGLHVHSLNTVLFLRYRRALDFFGHRQYARQRGDTEHNPKPHEAA